MSQVQEVPVLVVGGGPAGVTTSILLSRLGIDSLVVEKHQQLSPLPRARGVHARAMEILRSCHVEHEMRSHALPITPGVEWRSDLTCPPAHELAMSGPDEVEVSPCEGLATAQDVFESVLRDALGHDQTLDPGAVADLRMGTELVEVDVTADGVRSTLRNGSTGSTHEVRTRYLVAADGARSTMRRRLGIEMVGSPDLGSQLSIAFRADLHEHTGRVPRGLYFLTDSGAALFSTHPDDRWAISVPHLHDQPDPVAVVRSATGIADLDVEVITANVWTAAAMSATTYAGERIFLIGDAAHQTPPMGATGISTAMADAHNLAWKLAAVLEGRAGEALLATYSAEREPVGRHNAEGLGAAWMAMLSGAGLSAAPDIRQLDMGYQYASTAITPELDDPDDDMPTSPLPPVDGYRPSAAPGCRAPHVWVDRTHDISTIDLVGPMLTLLTGPSGRPWRDAAESATRQLGTPVAQPVIEAPAWQAAYGVEPTGAVLVRPDGHVTWRQRRLPDAPMPDIDRGLRAAIARSLALSNP